MKETPFQLNIFRAQSDTMLNHTEASPDGSYSGTLAGGSLLSDRCTENPLLGDRNELMLLPHTGDSASKETILRQLSTAVTGDSVDNIVMQDPQMVPATELGVLDDSQNLQSQRLSLSLRPEIPRIVSSPVPPCEYPNSDISSTHHPSLGLDGSSIKFCKGDGNSQIKVWQHSEYTLPDLAGDNRDTIILGALNDAQSFIRSRATHLDESSSLAIAIFNSKYLKPTQQLLDEVVNLWEALKHYKCDKNNLHGFGPDVSKETDVTPYVHTTFNGTPSDRSESYTDSCELSPAEQQHLQNRKSQLFSMLNEVERIYGQYIHQMQILVSSFDRVAGFGAAKPYTALAIRTISQHFRCLHDTIMGQIQVTQKSFGEHDPSHGQGGGITRLRYVDQQLKQQRVIKHLGVMQHVWRPQRGLPETSVSILRAWLFEHFLQPYPKDSEKTMLAKQAGLTRSQVANWFINARVRLWKPMVEEMYQGEFDDSEISFT